MVDESVTVTEMDTAVYYDPVTGDLLGHPNDIGQVPAGATPLEIPVGQMVCTSSFESDPMTLEAHVKYDFVYSSLVDNIGTGGVYFALLPKNINKPSVTDLYWVQTPVCTRVSG